MMTWAFGTAAPEGSFTMPVSVPVSACAQTVPDDVAIKRRIQAVLTQNCELGISLLNAADIYGSILQFLEDFCIFN
jgi:hypothetical protein